jgi:hypothetical protein
MSYKLYADKGIALNHAVALADANGAPVAVWQTVAQEGGRWYRVSDDPDFEEPGYDFVALVDPTEAV